MKTTGFKQGFILCKIKPHNPPGMFSCWRTQSSLQGLAFPGFHLNAIPILCEARSVLGLQLPCQGARGKQEKHGTKDLSTQSLKSSSLEILPVLKVGQLKVACFMPSPCIQTPVRYSNGVRVPQIPAATYQLAVPAQGTRNRHKHGYRSITNLSLQPVGVWNANTVQVRHGPAAGMVRRFPLACCLYRRSLSVPSVHIRC